MGEYALRADGQEIKVGTCESMYYLRFDQLDQITGISGSLDPSSPSTWDYVRFRFPFPHEDGIQPGEFADYDYSVALWGIEPPEIEHSMIQFVAREGFNVMLPCPVSLEGQLFSVESSKIHKNGYAGDVRIVQQRVWEGRLVLVAACGGCGSRYRYPTIEDVAPVLDWIDKQATRLALPGRDQDEPRAIWWRTIADRISAGYDLKL